MGADAVEVEGSDALAIAARYWMTFFVFSVLPAPDSPLVQGQRRHSSQSSFDIRDQDALALTLLANLLPCAFCNGKDVWSVLFSPLCAVLRDDLGGVDGERTVWVERDEE